MSGEYMPRPETVQPEDFFDSFGVTPTGESPDFSLQAIAEDPALPTERAPQHFLVTEVPLILMDSRLSKKFRSSAGAIELIYRHAKGYPYPPSDQLANFIPSKKYQEMFTALVTDQEPENQQSLTAFVTEHLESPDSLVRNAWFDTRYDLAAPIIQLVIFGGGERRVAERQRGELKDLPVHPVLSWLLVARFGYDFESSTDNPTADLIDRCIRQYRHTPEEPIISRQLCDVLQFSNEIAKGRKSELRKKRRSSNPPSLKKVRKIFSGRPYYGGW